MLIYIRGIYAATGIKITPELLPVLLRAGRVRSLGHSLCSGPWTFPSAACVWGCHRLCCHPELFLHLHLGSGVGCGRWEWMHHWFPLSWQSSMQGICLLPSQQWCERHPLGAGLRGKTGCVFLWDAPLLCSLIQCSSALWWLAHSHERWCHSSWVWYHTGIWRAFKLSGHDLRGDSVRMWISASSY